MLTEWPAGVGHPVDFNEITGLRWGIQGGNFLEGRYFDNNDNS